ncbi:MAG TPA: energy transducer TonB [Opitutaceae bacterium]|nr:energy transducer TonB [Opitutaceae bacterium]
MPQSAPQAIRPPLTSIPAGTGSAATEASRFVRDELVSWTVGFAFTFALFYGLAHLETNRAVPRPVQIEDLPIVSVPLDPPPPQPKPIDPTPVDESVPPLTGIDAGRSDSDVKIVVLPPDLEALLPTPRIPLHAMVSMGRLDTELKPHVNVQFDARHVYQQSEVDQRPRALVRVAPPVSPNLFGKESSLAVNLLLVIDTDGHAESARVVKSSGQPAFDYIVAETVKHDWLFSPAVKHGRKVRCLAQQTFRVVLGGDSPFSL